MAEVVTVTLPRGLFDESGVQHRVVELRPVTGHQEAALSSASAADPRAVSELLASTVARIGGYTEVTRAHAAALTRGDRGRLLLHLRRTLLGDRIGLVVRCPSPSCGALADVDLSAADLAPEPALAASEMLVVDTAAGPAVLREPTGADDEALLDVPGERSWRAAVLWSRLVLDLGGKGPIRPEEWLAADPAVRHAVALGLAEGSTAPDLGMLSPCPTCGALVELVVDPAWLLVRELAMGEDRLLAEVHCIAFHYHWSEDAILSLPRSRRWRYIELLRRQLEGRDAARRSR